MTRQAVAALALLILGAACDGNAFGPQEVQLAGAEARWSAAGPASYDFDVRVSCFCVGTTFGTVTVSVRNHQVAGIMRADSGTTVDTVYFQGVLTVDRMFAGAHEFLNSKPASFHAVYDPTLGYPTALSVDQDARAADDEFGFQVLALRAVSGP